MQISVVKGLILGPRGPILGQRGPISSLGGQILGLRGQKVEISGLMGERDEMNKRTNRRMNKSPPVFYRISTITGPLPKSLKTYYQRMDGTELTD